MSGQPPGTKRTQISTLSGLKGFFLGLLYINSYIYLYLENCYNIYLYQARSGSKSLVTSNN